MKIVLINHSYQVRYFYRRWQLLAHTHPDLDVTLLAPTEYEWYKDKDYTYDGGKKLYAKVIDEANFHIRQFRAVYPQRGDWTSSIKIRFVFNKITAVSNTYNEGSSLFY